MKRDHGYPDLGRYSVPARSQDGLDPEVREIPIIVQKLDPAFGCPKFGPGKDREAYVDHRGVEGIELAIKSELVSRSNRRSPGAQVFKQGPDEEFMTLFFSRRSERTSSPGLATAGMRAVSALRFESSTLIRPKIISANKLKQLNEDCV